MEKELIEFIAKKLVDDPNQVDVQMVEGEKSIVIELRTAREDIGKVIGKQGRIAKAIRIVMRAAAVRQGEKAIVEID